MDQPNKIRSVVCDLLEEVDFFTGTHPSPLHAIKQVLYFLLFIFRYLFEIIVLIMLLLLSDSILER